VRRKICPGCGAALEGHLVAYTGPRLVRCNMGHSPMATVFTGQDVINLRSSLGKTTTPTMRAHLKKVLG
jgi:hypothetical protein